MGFVDVAHGDGAPRKRVGLLPEGKAIAREGAEIAIGGKIVGRVTSGGFAPTSPSTLIHSCSWLYLTLAIQNSYPR